MAEGEITQQDLFTWAHAGLLRFQHYLMGEAGEDASELQAAFARALSGYPAMEWHEINYVLGGYLAEQSDGLAVLVEDAQRDLPPLFLFVLCSAIESDRGIAQRAANVQNLVYPAWLQLGFAADMLAYLFALDNPPNIHQFTLVQDGLLIINGQGPLVARSIYTSADYWQALESGRLLAEFSRIQDDGIQFADDLADTQAGFLSRKHLLAVETDHKSAEALTLSIAQKLGKTAIRMHYDDWQQKSLRALCRYAGWLPLVPCEKSATDELELPADFTPAILSIRSDQRLPENVIRIALPAVTAQTRKQWWEQWIDDQAALVALASSRLNQAAVMRIGKQLLRPKDNDVLQQVRIIRSADSGASLQRVAIPVSTWVTEDMLIFRADTQTVLKQCFARALERDYQHLGMGESIRATANPGLMYLFAGASGVGKTLASSWLASRLGAPLFKIDLAMIMNKYVGETEKNISLALDEAAKTDAILLFDEADALFGQRAESSHSGDRYANMLTNYLLSRIETHPGIVILTTNAGGRMDSAFQRRIDISIEFQALEYAERLQLWQAMLAGRNPGEQLCQRIARYCELAPGHVRNVVINACCWYPEQTPLSAHALWQGLNEEYRKVGRSMPSQLMALKADDGAGA